MFIILLSYSVLSSRLEMNNNFNFDGNTLYSQPWSSEVTNSSLYCNSNQQVYARPNQNVSYSGLEQNSLKRPKETRQNYTPVLHNGSSVYQVKFKKGVRYYLKKPDYFFEYHLDDIVVVEADRGEDIGVISGIFTAAMYCEARRQNSIRCGTSGVKEEDGSWDLRFISRFATTHDMQLVAIKNAEEAAVTQRARELAYRHYRLPIKIVDAEFQFDRNKLTIIFETNSRVDFRDFVRELFSIYKVRIWMQQIEVIESDSDRNDYAINQLQSTEPIQLLKTESIYQVLQNGSNFNTEIFQNHLPTSNYIGKMNHDDSFRTSSISLSSSSNDSLSRVSPVFMEPIMYSNINNFSSMQSNNYNFRL